jgi:hypothetical protein
VRHEAMAIGDDGAVEFSPTSGSRKPAGAANPEGMLEALGPLPLRGGFGSAARTHRHRVPGEAGDIGALSRHWHRPNKIPGGLSPSASRPGTGTSVSESAIAALQSLADVDAGGETIFCSSLIPANRMIGPRPPGRPAKRGFPSQHAGVRREALSKTRRNSLAVRLLSCRNRASYF